MKRKCVLVMMGILLLGGSCEDASAQCRGNKETRAIMPQRLAISFSKTTNLVFPYAIRSVDRGTPDVLVQKAIGVENILQVKAGQPQFKETNLTVVTADGSLYSYLLHYAEKPSMLTIKAASKDEQSTSVAVFTEDATTSTIENNAAAVATKKRTEHNLLKQKHRIGISIKGIYIDDDVLYFQLHFQNNSNISYDVSMLRFFLRDKKKSKRTASQEQELEPLHIHGNTDVVGGHSEQIVVVALPKFTVPDKKYLVIQLMEASGGRHLSLKVQNKHILSCRRI